MNCKRLVYTVAFYLVVSAPLSSYAAHPLITDDAYTQGRGKFQLEVNGQYDYDKEKVEGVTVKATGGTLNSILSYGIIDSIDLVFGVPYVWSKVSEDGETVLDEHGMSDMTFEVKWRFFEKQGYSLALKPGISVPTGNENRGLGSGRVGYSAFFIASKEFAPWNFHLNLGYARNENIFDEHKDIWHASFAAMYEAVKGLNIVGNIGIEKNADRTNDDPLAFLIAGLIYSPLENFDLDFGVKTGLSRTETDLSFLAGITLRF